MTWVQKNYSAWNTKAILSEKGVRHFLSGFWKAIFLRRLPAPNIMVPTRAGSRNIYRLKKLCIAEYGELKDMESIAICGLLHDLCKTNFYAVSTRNVKNEKTGMWEKQPYYTVVNKFPLGHGEKSVFLIERFLRLTPEEALSIRWHMGGFDDAAKGYALTGAYERCPLALLLHMADMMATYLDENKTEGQGGVICGK